MFRLTVLMLGVYLFVSAGNISAQEFPTRPLRFIVPVNPGGGSDIIARLIGKHLQERLGQPVIVDNRPGADTIIGTQITARAAPDGHTFLLSYIVLAAQPALRSDLPYDVLKDLIPVIHLMNAPNVAAVRRSLPVKSIPDLIALAKEKPGQLTYASGGVGGPSHLAPLLFSSLAGVKLNHIPYKGASPALNDVIGERVDVIFATIVSTAPHAQAGRLRALAVTGSKRSHVFPELPTIAEAGVKGYQYDTWYGVFLPSNTPRPIVQKLYSEIRAIITTDEVTQFFLKSGAQVVGSGPDEFSAYVKSELKKWSRTLKEAGVQIDMAR